jgi:hypothetical protein
MAVSTKKAFRVCEKWGFKCAYCGEKPGRSCLQIDHLIPRCKRGSDDEENLVPACVACNQGKGGDIYVPPSLRLATDDDECHVLCQSGVWAIKAGVIGVFISGAVYGEHRIHVSADCYELASHQIWDQYLVDHVCQKTWQPPHQVDDFKCVVALARRIICPPRPALESESGWSCNQETRLKQLRRRHSTPLRRGGA